MRADLEADPAEARAVEIIRELRAAGWSVRRIAEELDARGVPARGPGIVADTASECVVKAFEAITISVWREEYDDGTN
jgi:hypothetical protein